jgi:hypothetical protein
MAARGVVDPAIEPLFLARIQTAARVRHVTGRAITAVAVSLGAFFVVLTALALLDAAHSLPQFVRLEYLFEADQLSWQQYLMAPHYRNVVLSFVGLYLALFGLPFVVALPVAGAIVLLWRDPPRILVLRPFNRRPLTRGLARLVDRDVARFGHIYSLADAELRVRWYVRVPFLLGQLALLSFRSRIITKPRQVRDLERATRRTWLRNINWCLSWRKFFAVATDDAHWQQVVELLVNRATVILIDLTEARPNVRWEIALIERLGLARRVVWVLRAGDPVEVLQHAGIQVEPDAVFRYDGKGSQDGAALRAAIAERVAEERQSQAAFLRKGRTLSIVALAMFVVGCLPLLALWFEALAERLSRSEFHGQSVALLIVLFGLATLATLGLALLRNRNAIFFVGVQFVLLAGAILVGG